MDLGDCYLLAIGSTSFLFQTLRRSYPLLRHNCGNQFVVGDIECGVIDLYAVCGHALFVPHIGDFSGGALFDVDVCACWGVHIDGGGGSADVEGDSKVFGEDGDT